MKKPDTKNRTLAPCKPIGRKGPVNPQATAQSRKVMGKHYAAKYGVSKRKG